MHIQAESCKSKNGARAIRSSCVSGKLTILPKPDIQIKILDKSLYLLELQIISNLCKHHKKIAITGLRCDVRRTLNLVVHFGLKKILEMVQSNWFKLS